MVSILDTILFTESFLKHHLLKANVLFTRFSRKIHPVLFLITDPE